MFYKEDWLHGQLGWDRQLQKHGIQACTLPRLPVHRFEQVQEEAEREEGRKKMPLYHASSPSCVGLFAHHPSLSANVLGDECMRRFVFVVIGEGTMMGDPQVRFLFQWILLHYQSQPGVVLAWTPIHVRKTDLHTHFPV